VSALAWSADGTRLATVSHDLSVRIWSRDADAVAVLLGYTGPVNDVAWSPDGSRLATARHDHTVRVWSSSGSALHQLVGHTDRVHAVACSPDGTDRDQRCTKHLLSGTRWCGVMTEWGGAINAHNPKVGSSNPLPTTKRSVQAQVLDLGFAVGSVFNRVGWWSTGRPTGRSSRPISTAPRRDRRASCPPPDLEYR
jgi:hypothetical protein